MEMSQDNPTIRWVRRGEIFSHDSGLYSFLIMFGKGKIDSVYDYETKERMYQRLNYSTDD